MSRVPENKRVLVIDDNRAIHEDFRKVLTDSGSDAGMDAAEAADRKSTRLNSSHSQQSRMPSSA